MAPFPKYAEGVSLLHGPTPELDLAFSTNLSPKTSITFFKAIPTPITFFKEFAPPRDHMQGVHTGPGHMWVPLVPRCQLVFMVLPLLDGLSDFHDFDISNPYNFL